MTPKTMEGKRKKLMDKHSGEKRKYTPVQPKQPKSFFDYSEKEKRKIVEKAAIEGAKMQKTILDGWNNATKDYHPEQEIKTTKGTRTFKQTLKTIKKIQAKLQSKQSLAHRNIPVSAITSSLEKASQSKQETEWEKYHPSKSPKVNKKNHIDLSARLHQIWAMIPLTWGLNARKEIKRLIDEVEKL